MLAQNVFHNQVWYLEDWLASKVVTIISNFRHNLVYFSTQRHKERCQFFKSLITLLYSCCVDVRDGRISEIRVLNEPKSTLTARHDFRCGGIKQSWQQHVSTTAQCLTAENSPRNTTVSQISLKLFLESDNYGSCNFEYQSPTAGYSTEDRCFIEAAMLSQLPE